MKRVSTQDFSHKKSKGEKITVLTAYDYPTAKLLDEAGIDGILVGDSVGNVILGHDTTIPVTMDEMIHHTKAVARGCTGALIIGDMPFLTYHTGIADALRNAGRFLQEGGAQAVKLEGGLERVEVIKSLVQAGIPVMGHLGLTPQSVHQLGGFKVQGRTEAAAQKLLEDATALEQAGVFAIVLECIPAGLAKRVTEAINVPTIGIGAGPACDGQVLVTHDMLGFNGANAPKFVKQFCNLKELMLAGIRAYSEEVKAGEFPAPEQTFQPLEQGELKKLY